MCTYTLRAEIISPESDRSWKAAEAARRWTAPTTAGRPCEMLVIVTGTAPRRCVSSPPHARRTARIARDDRRCDSSTSAVGVESEAVVEARLPRRHATCTRRCNASVVPDRSDTNREIGPVRSSVRSRPDTRIRRSPRTPYGPARRARSEAAQPSRGDQPDERSIGGLRKGEIATGHECRIRWRRPREPPQAQLGNRRRSPRPGASARPATQPHRLTRADCAEPTACVTGARATARLARAEMPGRSGHRLPQRCPMSRGAEATQRADSSSKRDRETEHHEAAWRSNAERRHAASRQ